MRLQWKLTVASLKMFTRQKEAIVWTMLLPLFMVFLFGFVSFEGMGRIQFGVAGAENEPAARLVGRLGEVRTVQVTRGAESAELEQLEAGKRHLVLVLPQGFDPAGKQELRVLVNDGTPEETQMGLLILRKVLDDATFGVQSGARSNSNGDPIGSQPPVQLYRLPASRGAVSGHHAERHFWSGLRIRFAAETGSAAPLCR